MRPARRHRCRCTCTCLVRAQMPVLRFQFARARGALPFDGVRRCADAPTSTHDLPTRRWGRAVAVSVFFGGGTPSLFPPDAIDALPRAAQRAPALRAGPRDHAGDQSRHGRARPLRRLPRAPASTASASACRASTTTCLQRLGRIHDSARGRARGQARAGRRLRQLQPRPDVRAAAGRRWRWRARRRRTRDRAAARAHLALPAHARTEHAVRRAAAAGIPDEDAAWDMQEACQARLAAAGYAQYEVVGLCAAGPAVRAQPQLLAVRRLPRHRRRRARQAHPRRSGQQVLRRWKVKHPARIPGQRRHAGARSAATRPSRPGALPFDYMLNALRLRRRASPLAAFEARTGLPRAAIAARTGTASERGWIDRAWRPRACRPNSAGASPTT